MNKNAIQRFAIWARKEMITQVSQRAFQYGITEEGWGDYNAVAVAGRVLIGDEMKQRQQLIDRIRDKGYSQVMEEVAYTWFNRFIALRFMEVKNYLPTHIRVFSDASGAFKPEILSEALHLDLPGLDMSKVAGLIEENRTEDLYRYLLLTQCNALHSALPFMFEEMDAYTELLLPNNILRPDGILGRMVAEIPEEDWADQVQIIGWLYQYYNTELKDDTFALLKKNVKITKERIPSATQLFTPDWIVRYMVENSLGRVVSGQWLVDSDKWSEEGRIEAQKKFAEEMGWRYFIPDAPQSEEVRKQLSSLTTDHCSLTTIKLIDPCMGSGHILVYAFDVLIQAYQKAGYSERDAAQSILENNLYGLDIDDRAAQLAYFAVMMKARQYDRRIFSRNIRPHVYAIVESNAVERRHLKYLGESLTPLERAAAAEEMNTLLDELKDAKEYGSILNIKAHSWELLRRYASEGNFTDQMQLGDIGIDETRQKLAELINVGEVLAQKYDVVVTNPPYMGANGMNSKLSEYVKKYYPDSKSDLFAVFIEKWNNMLKKYGYNSMVTMQSWMFLSSFEKMRTNILASKTITNLMHMDNMVLGIAFGTAVTVFMNKHISHFKGTYNHIKLSDIENERPKEFPVPGNRFAQVSSDNFSKIPGSPVAYWVNNKVFYCFDTFPHISDVAFPASGTSTGNNDLFLRLWHEVSFHNIAMGTKPSNLSDKKWFPCNKGGSYRKWSGGNEYIIDWENDGYQIKHCPTAYLRNVSKIFEPGITWSKLGSGSFSTRLFSEGYICESIGCCLFKKNTSFLPILALLNSKIAQFLLNIINPSLGRQPGYIGAIPYSAGEMEYEISTLTEENVILSKQDWDSFETSWDFEMHPLVSCQCPVVSGQSDHCSLITDHFSQWQQECNDRFQQLKSNEEELNRIFIDIYGLQDELTPEVDDKDVTVRKADLKRDIKSLISYAVGCMFGRYSIDVPGLAFAGGEFSDEWVVVSGQYYRKEVVGYYVSEELSRVDSMAEIYGFGRDGLQPCKISAQNGNVRSVGSDTQSGSVNPFKYCRGTVKKLYEGICELFVNSKRVELGSGDPAFDLCSPEILGAITNKTGDGLVSRGWKDAEHIDWAAIHKKLTTNHCPLSTNHCPLIDSDNIIPICDDEYFDDDIVGRFVEFVKVVYGEKTLEDNLKFIADALGGKGTPREVIRGYFLNDFYADHLKTYQKRPIYWLFDSGKKNGFKALIYMHRYRSDLLARMRTDYVHEQQERYRTQLRHVADAMDAASASERVKLAKRQQKLQEQALELQKYEEKIHHLADMNINIDLDDGVKVNYAKFEDVLAKIK